MGGNGSVPGACRTEQPQFSKPLFLAHSLTHSNLAAFVSLCYDAVWYLSSWARTVVHAEVFP